MSIFTWNDLSKNEKPEKTGSYIIFHENGVIEMSVFDTKDGQWKLYATKDSPITHWTDYKKLGKPYSYQG